jgi:phosphoribosylanthranilate isomerase
MTADWSAIAAWKKGHASGIPIVLAGGLNPANVASAIEAVAPAAVDTASGVESSPGHKQADLVAKFVQASKQAFTKR